MKKLSIGLIVFLVLGISLYVVKYRSVANLSFYEITCGSGENEVQYLATEEKDGLFLVEGEYRPFPGCTSKLIEPKTP